MISNESAVTALSLDDIDMDKVKKLQEHPDLIHVMDNWILSPNRELIPKLHELADTVNRLYTHPKVLTLYRGFDLNNYQDSMGIDSPPTVGQVVYFKSDERALSFSTEINIARSYGGIVVGVRLDTTKTSFLNVTPELCYLVGERRNFKNHQTQKEVIVLPSFDIEGTVVQNKRYFFGSLGW